MSIRGATGREVEMIFQGGDVASAWGTAVDMDTTSSGFWALERGVGRVVEQLNDDAAGYAWLKQVDEGNEAVTGGPPQHYRFDNNACLYFIALAMGAYAYTDEVTASQGDHRHAMTLATSNITRFGTMAWQHQVGNANDPWEVPSYKPAGFTLEGSEGGLVQLTPIGIGNLCIHSGLVNSFTTITYPGVASRIVFSKLKIEMGPTAGAYTTYNPSSFTFTFDRSMTPDFVAHESAGSDEPEGEGYPIITLSVGFPQYGHKGLSDTGVNAWFSDADLKVKITYAGAQIGTGEFRGFELECPVVHIIDDDPQFSGPGKIPETINFNVLQGSALPFTFTGYSDSVTDLGIT